MCLLFLLLSVCRFSLCKLNFWWFYFAVFSRSEKLNTVGYSHKHENTLTGQEEQGQSHSHSQGLLRWSVSKQNTNETKKTFERSHQMWTRDVNTDREASASSGFVACTDNIENSTRVDFPGLNLSSEKRSCYRGAVVQEFFFFKWHSRGGLSCAICCRLLLPLLKKYYLTSDSWAVLKDQSKLMNVFKFDVTFYIPEIHLVS